MRMKGTNNWPEKDFNQLTGLPLGLEARFVGQAGQAGIWTPPIPP